MPRVPGRGRDRMRELLFAVVGEEARRAVLDVGATRPLIPIEVKAVLRKANERLRQESPGLAPLTTGFIQASFGGRDQFLDDAMAEFLGPDTTVGSEIAKDAVRRLAAGAAPEEVRQSVAFEDAKAMARDFSDWARVWLVHLAHSRRLRVAQVVHSVYERFDDAYVPLYELELKRRGRAMLPGFEIKDLAIAMTAVTEGLAIRYLGDSLLTQARRRRILGTRQHPGLAGHMSEAVFLALTQPIEDPTGTPPHRPRAAWPLEAAEGRQ